MDGRKALCYQHPGVSTVGRGVDFPAGSSEIDAAWIERVDSHRFTQYVHITIVLRQAFGKRLPLVSARAAAVNSEFALGRKVLRLALDRNDIDRLWLVGVNVLRGAMGVDSLDECGIYFGTTGGEVYASSDAGDSWTLIAQRLPPILSVEVQTLP